MYSPSWLKVLAFHEQHGIIWNGLTIPFLIGAERLLNEKQSKYSVKDFFENVNNLKTPITILKCSQIHEFVIGTLDSETQLILNKNPNTYLRIGNIICTDESLKDFKTADDFSAFCCAEYEKIIQTDTFSLQNGAWRTFNRNELENIKRSAKM